MTYSATWNVESSYNADLNNDQEMNASAVKTPDPNSDSARSATGNNERKRIEADSQEIDKSIGFNPYDTGVLQQQKIKD